MRVDPKSKLNRKERRKHNNKMKKNPLALVEIPKDKWPHEPPSLKKVYMSRHFMVQLFVEGPGRHRMSVSHTQVAGDNQWTADIKWDELQLLKNEIGFGDKYAVEVYPKDKDLVNVANMRHLWILDEALDIGWTNMGSAKGVS